MSCDEAAIEQSEAENRARSAVWTLGAFRQQKHRLRTFPSESRLRSCCVLSLVFLTFVVVCFSVFVCCVQIPPALDAMSQTDSPSPSTPTSESGGILSELIHAVRATQREERGLNQQSHTQSTNPYATASDAQYASGFSSSGSAASQSQMASTLQQQQAMAAAYPYGAPPGASPYAGYYPAQSYPMYPPTAAGYPGAAGYPAAYPSAAYGAAPYGYAYPPQPYPFAGQPTAYPGAPYGYPPQGYAPQQSQQAQPFYNTIQQALQQQQAQQLAGGFQPPLPALPPQMPQSPSQPTVKDEPVAMDSHDTSSSERVVAETLAATAAAAAAAAVPSAQEQQQQQQQAITRAQAAAATSSAQPMMESTSTLHTPSKSGAGSSSSSSNSSNSSAAKKGSAASAKSSSAKTVTPKLETPAPSAATSAQQQQQQQSELSAASSAAVASALQSAYLSQVVQSFSPMPSHSPPASTTASTYQTPAQQADQEALQAHQAQQIAAHSALAVLQMQMHQAQFNAAAGIPPQAQWAGLPTFGGAIPDAHTLQAAGLGLATYDANMTLQQQQAMIALALNGFPLLRPPPIGNASCHQCQFCCDAAAFARPWVFD